VTSKYGLLQLADHLPWRIAKAIRHLIPPSHAHCSVISTDPAIVVIPEDFYDSPALWQPFFGALADKKVSFLCLVLSGIEGYDWDYKKLLSRVLADHMARYPRHNFTFLANDPAQEKIFRNAGITSVFVNHNALVDDGLFTIHQGSVKKYDAIYNAVMLPYKRHALCAQISNLALVTYFKPGNDEYFEGMKRLLSHAAWLNFESHPASSDHYHPIPKRDIPRHLNAARVGLCLSEKEGAMFASVEYLLCGLPIVSTPSIGGRDVFFDSDYVEIVDPTPDAVRQGVAEIMRRSLSPTEIRNKTLKKIAEHRARLVDVVKQIYFRQGKRIELQDAQSRLFSSSLYQVRDLHRVAAAL
jgi:glycosyltransferase involved in cell wall biosynthesis